jgi:hypothetical protein
MHASASVGTEDDILSQLISILPLNRKEAGYSDLFIPSTCSVNCSILLNVCVDYIYQGHQVYNASFRWLVQYEIHQLFAYLIMTQHRISY